MPADQMGQPPCPIVLYVDDEILIQAMVFNAFEDSGLDLLVADSAEQAALMLGDPIGHGPAVFDERLVELKIAGRANCQETRVRIALKA